VLQNELYFNAVCSSFAPVFFRLSTCKFSRIGCPWKGPYHELKEHEDGCLHPQKSGGEVMDALGIIDQNMSGELQLFKNIFSLLSSEKITFNGK